MFPANSTFTKRLVVKLIVLPFLLTSFAGLATHQQEDDVSGGNRDQGSARGSERAKLDFPKWSNRDETSKERIENLFGSLQFKVMFTETSPDMRKEGTTWTGGTGNATLIGFKKLDNLKCKYVFLTVAHNFRDAKKDWYPDKIWFSSKLLAGSDSYELRLHPKTILSRSAPLSDQFDVALLTVVGKCPTQEVPTPIRLADGPQVGNRAFVERTY